MAVRERRATQGAGGNETVAFSRAAEELGLKPGELELAIQLEEVRTVAAPGTGRRRVPRQELDRLRQAEDFPEGLRERVRAVGTAEGAQLMGISPERFTRLARVGLLSPVKFYVNRYRAVVWLYPAAELRRFAEKEPALLTGVTPKGLRTMLDAGEDWRARSWRSRRVGQLARQTDDPWERAAVPAAVLPGDDLADIVDDPYERAYLRRLRPALVPVRADIGATWDVVARLITADDPDEILWIRLGLTFALDEARAVRPAPMPGDSPSADPPPDRPPGTDLGSHAEGPPAARGRRLRGWLRRRTGRGELSAGQPPGRAALARPDTSSHRSEQPLLHHRHEQPARAVEDLTAGQPPGSGGDG
jgi:hypothetical protein